MPTQQIYWHTIVIPLVAVILSIGSSIFISGENSGVYKEKITTLEAKIGKQEDYGERLARIETKLDNIENLLKELRKNKND